MLLGALPTAGEKRASVGPNAAALPFSYNHSTLPVLKLTVGTVLAVFETASEMTFTEWENDYRAVPHDDVNLRTAQNRARYELWNWIDDLSNTGAAAQLLGSFGTNARKGIKYLLPQSYTYLNRPDPEGKLARRYADKLRKPEKNKDGDQLKCEMPRDFKTFVREYFHKMLKAFDRSTLLLISTKTPPSTLNVLKARHGDDDIAILEYSFIHSKFQNAGQRVLDLQPEERPAHTLFLFDPPWGTSPERGPSWDQEDKAWQLSHFDEALDFVEMANPNNAFDECTIIFHVPDFYLPMLFSAAQRRDLFFVVEVWAKNAGNAQGNRLRWNHELIVVVSNRQNHVRGDALYNAKYPAR